MQDDFDNIMREYPESSKAMDLIAEHRLRSLHGSAAWQSKQDALIDAKAASLGSKIEHVLEASYAPAMRNVCTLAHIRPHSKGRSSLKCFACPMP